MSQAVAERLGVTRQAVHQWRTGKRVPGDEHIEELSKLFHLPFARVRTILIRDRVLRSKI